MSSHHDAKKRILIIDDEADNREIIGEMLVSSFSILAAESGTQGLKLAVAERPALILLDISMPDLNGFEVCRKLKANPETRQIPVFFLTGAFNEVTDRVKGLDSGADDYIGKPFDGRELIARINARLRLQSTGESNYRPLTFGKIRIDPKSLQTTVGDEDVRLTKVEFDLLHYFLSRPNEIIDRSKVLADLWPNSVVTQRTVDTHVANLRKKLSAGPFPLETIYGAGYILRPLTNK